MQLLITRKDGSYDYSQLVTQVTWAGEYRRCCRSLQAALLCSPVDENQPKVRCELGDAVRFFEDGKLLFSGTVYSREKRTGSSVLQIGCFDRGLILKNNEASYKFENMTPEQIAAKVCGDFGIEAGALAKTGIPISRKFMRVSLYQIIQTAYTLAAERNKKQYQILFDGPVLMVQEKGADKTAVVIAGGSNLMEASTSESIENAVSRVAIYDQSGALLRTMQNEDTIKLAGVMQKALVQPKNAEDVTARAQGLLDSGGVTQKITVDILGNTQCITGRAVVMQEQHTGLMGMFYIESDTHQWKNGLHTCKLTLNFKSLMDTQKAGG